MWGADILSDVLCIIISQNVYYNAYGVKGIHIKYVQSKLRNKNGYGVLDSD